MSAPRGKFGSTQKDIAQELGLSQGAVAYALDPLQQHKLLPGTVDRVLAKATELHYRPQRFARSLRKGRTHTIGVVFQSGLYHAPQERVKFLAQETHKAGFRLVAVDMEWFQNDEHEVREYLLDSSPEGVIFCNLPSELGEWERVFAQRSLPAIALASQTGGGIEQAGVDMRSAYQKMTKHHLAQGSRKLTLLIPYHDPDFIGWPGNSIMHRVEGFKAAILAAGGVIEVDEITRELLELPGRSRKKNPAVVGEVLYPEKTDDFHNVFEFGAFQAQRLIDENRLPDSLICSNDEIAAACLSVCQRNGILVPDDLKISGADDAPFSRFLGVPLTTIRQPSQEMAAWAIKRIVELIEKPAQCLNPQSKTFAGEIITRASTVSLNLPTPTNLDQPQPTPKNPTHPSHEKVYTSSV